MSDLQVLRERRNTLATVLLAAENAAKVMQICSSTSTDTVGELAQAFGISDFQAQVILEMQLRRFAPEAAAAVRAELADVDRRISDVEAR